MGVTLSGNRVERRLAAIVAAVVAGFSRLMGLDEVGTARTLREHRAVSDALVAKHGGRIVKTTGDGVLLEFPSVVDAVDAVEFADLGEQSLKNIDRPVHVFRVGGRVEGSQGFTLPPLISDRPSIAVLPFICLSENRNLKLLADGLVEDVIALLARVPGFFVIARSSSFAYRSTTQDVRHVGRELGVRYVVEGSIRASDKRARISTQLVEAESGKQIWTSAGLFTAYKKEIDLGEIV